MGKKMDLDKIIKDHGLGKPRAMKRFAKEIKRWIKETDHEHEANIHPTGH